MLPCSKLLSARQPTRVSSKQTMRSFCNVVVTDFNSVIYTEIDLRMNTPSTPEKLAVQAKAYERVAKSCLAVKRCVGMTVWVR